MVILFFRLCTFFIISSFLSVVSFGAEKSELDSSEGLVTKFYICPNIGEYITNENKQIVYTNSRVFGATGGGLGAIGGGFLGASGGYGIYYLGTQLTGVQYSAAQAVVASGSGAVLGAAVGAYAGAKYGAYVGEERAKKWLRDNLHWRQDPCFTLAFHTTNGDKTVYFSTIKLVPIGGDWVDHDKDGDSVYVSNVEMRWFIGDRPNDGSSLFRSACEEYAEHFSGNPADFVSTFKRTREQYLAPTDQSVHIDNAHNGVHQASVFAGETRALSLHDIVDAIDRITNQTTDKITNKTARQMPCCSHSGKVHEKFGDVVNPISFICRILNQLGVGIDNTTMSRFLMPNQSGQSITRLMFLSELELAQERLRLNSHNSLIATLKVNMENNKKDNKEKEGSCVIL